MGDFAERVFNKRTFKYKMALIVTLIGLISLISGGSYAVLKGNLSSENKQIIEMGKVKLLLTEDYEDINSTATVLSDVDGLLLENKYHFSIKNIGDGVAKIDVKLLNIAPDGYSGDLLDNEYIRVGLQVNGEEQGPMTLSEVRNIIDSNIINKDEIINYNLRIWLDESKGSELRDLSDSKMFLKLAIDAEQRVKEKNVEQIVYGYDDLDLSFGDTIDLDNYYENIADVGEHSFAKFIVTSSGVIKSAEACGKYNNEFYCLKPGSSNYEQNKQVLNDIFGAGNCSEYEDDDVYKYSCSVGLTNASAFSDGGVYSGYGGGICGVSTDNTIHFRPPK